MKTTIPLIRNARGFTLLEALIGVVILSVGMLSVARLQTELVASSGLSKARSEAIQLAEGDMETTRNMVVVTNYNAIASGTRDDILGKNATFDLARIVATLANPARKQVDVVVTWTDPKEGLQSVRVSDVLAWNNPADGVTASSESLGSDTTRLKTPTGRAVQGGRTYDEGKPDGATSNTYSDGSNDGTYTYVADDGKRELLIELPNGDYKAVLTVADGSHFSTVAGKVYSTDLGMNTADTAGMYVISSDASYCANDKSTIQFWRASGADKLYTYFDYVCYVGAEWYGNVGIVRTGNFQSNDRICVGGPDEMPTGAWNSLNPALSSIRSYRGFKTVVTTADTSVGIGIDPVTGAYTHQAYTGHDFLLSTINGQPDDDACNDPLQLINSSDPFGSNPVNAVSRGNLDTPPNNANPGEGFCLTALCPAGSTPPPTSTLISFTLNAAPSNFKPDVSMTIDGGTCISQFAGSKLTGINCTMSWGGWVGETWSGTINVTSNGQNGGLLCSTGATTPVTTVNNVDVPVSGIAITGQSIVYTTIPIALENIKQTVTIAKTPGDCP